MNLIFDKQLSVTLLKDIKKFFIWMCFDANRRFIKF